MDFSQINNAWGAAGAILSIILIFWKDYKTEKKEENRKKDEENEKRRAEASEQKSLLQKTVENLAHIQKDLEVNNKNTQKVMEQSELNGRKLIEHEERIAVLERKRRGKGKKGEENE